MYRDFSSTLAIVCVERRVLAAKASSCFARAAARLVRAAVEVIAEPPGRKIHHSTDLARWSPRRLLQKKPAGGVTTAFCAHRAYGLLIDHVRRRRYVVDVDDGDQVIRENPAEAGFTTVHMSSGRSDTRMT